MAEVIGVARTVNYQAIGEKPKPFVYLSIMQYYFPTAVLFVRSTGNVESVLATVHREVQTLDRNLLLQSETVHSTIEESLWSQRLSAGRIGREQLGSFRRSADCPCIRPTRKQIAGQ